MNSKETKINKTKTVLKTYSSYKNVKSETLKIDEITTRNKLKKFREVETGENVNSSKDQNK